WEWIQGRWLWSFRKRGAVAGAAACGAILSGRQKQGQWFLFQSSSGRQRLVLQHRIFNGVNFDMLCNTNDTSSTYDVPGFDHVMKNNVGYRAKFSEVANLGPSTTNDITFNYFTLPVTVAASDFVTLD